MYGRMLNEKKEMARVINSQYEENKFDFVPKINKKSEKIVLEKSRYLYNQMSAANINCSPMQMAVDGPPVEGRDMPASPMNLKNLEDQMKYIGMTNISPNDEGNMVFSPPNERNLQQFLLSPKSSMKERKF